MFPGKTLVLGGGGFLGSYFSHIISSDSVVHLSPRGVLNPRFNQFVFEIGQNNLGELGAYILKQDFACVINCIANANIEDCEQHPERAYF